MKYTFRAWLEEKEGLRKTKHQLLSRLGLEDATVKLRQIEKSRLQQALESMDLDEDKLNSIMSWLSRSPDSRVIDLIKQIGTEEAPEALGELPGQPAQLPQGQPEPPPNPMQQSGMQNLQPPMGNV